VGGKLRKRRGAARQYRKEKQDRRRVAGGQGYEVRYESKKTGKGKETSKTRRQGVGNSRRKVERELRQ